MNTKGKKFSFKSFYEQFCNGVTDTVNSKSKKILLGYFVFISVLEILAYKIGGIFSVVASRIWLITALLLFVAFLVTVITKVIEDIKEKRWVDVIGFLALLGIFGYYIGNLGYADINADAAQQLAAGASSFSAPDWNYTGLAFLGYANRQYVLGALPAVVFGRSVFTLHLGFAGPFLVGLVLMYFEFREWLKKDGISEMVALIPCYAMLGFRFITEYYLNFEQAITPVALTMMGIALFMKLCRNVDSLTVVALTWVGCFFCDSYTPIIASLGLLLCFLALYIIDIYLKNMHILNTAKDSEEGHNAITRMQVLGGSAITMVCFFVATLVGKRSDRLTSMREEIDLDKFAFEVWGEFFTDKNAAFLGMFLGIVLLYLCMALTFRLKFYDFVIAVWTFGVVLFANLLVGYTSYEKAWILQRNMIVIPVLVTVIFLWMVRILCKYKIQADHKCLVILMLFFTVIGIANFGSEHQSFNYFRYIQPMKYMISYTEDVLDENKVKDTDEFNVLLVTDNVLQSNIYDYAKFFYPNASTYSMTSDGELPEMDWSLDTYVFAETEEQLWYMGLEAQSRTYKNPRYDTSVTWYYSKVN